MIEKCSIGNMTNNIQNITLILLILILIIVIIYYLKNSNAKHNELIEKYTNTPIESSDASYITHYSANSQRNSNFPSTGTTVTLRDCQVQFNNTFTKDDNVTVDDNATVKYTYGDEWKEIDTLTEPGSSPIRIPEKIISRSNETNAADITNYSERSKCFRRMTASDNKYRYAGNNLIQYRAGSASEQGIHSELKVGTDGTLENYMEMKFYLDPSNSTNYYNNLTSSICSLQYTNNLGGNNGSGLGGVSLYRLTLDTNNKITAINQITINSTNNHIFTVSQTTSFADLLTSTSTISYVYSGGNFNFQSNSSLSTETNIIGVKIYKFNRELLCSHVQNNIKSYQIFDNKKIDANKIVNVSAASVSQVINSTSFPNATSSYASKNAVKTAIEERIKTDIATANTQAISDETTANNLITTRTGERDAFLTDINTKEKYLDKIFDTTLDASKKDFLIKMGSLELDKLGYQTEDVSSFETILTSRQEPLFSNSQGGDIYTIETYTDTSMPYTKTFNTNTACDILIVGGGGGGGYDRAAGGGAGGLLLYTDRLVNAGTYTIKVGKGGIGDTGYGARGTLGNGFSSSIEGLSGAIALGGGRGGSSGNMTNDFPNSGGSGGGGAGNAGWTTNTGSSGTSGQGNSGGNMVATSGSFNSAGGGGAGGNGGNGLQGVNPANSGNGGIGRDMSSYFGTSFGQSGWFAGGGGGSQDFGSFSSATNSTSSRGGQGGGGNAGLARGQSGSNGTAGTGGGGGGGGNIPQGSGGNGGSGIVLIRYRNVPEQIGNEKQITLTNPVVYDVYFPRVPATNSFTWTDMGNTVNVKVSDDVLGTQYVYFLFNHIITSQDHYHSLQSYTGIGNTYSGATRFKTFAGIAIGVDYGRSIYPKRMRIAPRPLQVGFTGNDFINGAPKAFKIFASDDVSCWNDNNHSSWTEIHNQTTALAYTNEQYTIVNITANQRKYRYYTMVVLSTIGNYAGGYMMISEWNIGGDENIDYSYISQGNMTTYYKATFPISTDVTINGNKAKFDAGTYDIIMGPSGSEIRNRTSKILFGNYAYRDGNKLEFKYAITKTLQQLHDDSTSFSGTIYTIGMSDQKYSLGNKTLGTIKKYRVYIYKRLLNHTIELYANNTLLNKGTDYITDNDEDAVPKTINLRNLYITINKNIAGIIYLKSDKPIFFISETNRTSFNNTTDTLFGTNVNNLKASGTATLSSLNNIFRVSEATTALTTAQNRKITYNINTILESPLTISYNSSTINPAGKNSLDNLMTTYNNIHRYNESSGGSLTEKINEYTFENILNPAETDIKKYISYEYPTAPTADKLTPSSRNTAFDIRSNATKYIYFRKSS